MGAILLWSSTLIFFIRACIAKPIATIEYSGFDTFLSSLYSTAPHGPRQEPPSNRPKTLRNNP